jgi:L-lactate utilization protein LutB
MPPVTQYSASNLMVDARVDPDRWSRIPDEATIEATVPAIEARGMRVILADTDQDALSALVDQIPEGAEVMSGSSTTLIEIRFANMMKKNPKGWRDCHSLVSAENDEARRHELRRKSVAAEFFLSGVQAIAETGQVVGCDRSGSRVGAWPHAAKHLLLVSGVNKIVPTLEDAVRRCREYALPLEVQRSQRVYGTPSQISNIVILEHSAVPGRITLVLVRERLGY